MIPGEARDKCGCALQVHARPIKGDFIPEAVAAARVVEPPLAAADTLHQNRLRRIRKFGVEPEHQRKVFQAADTLARSAIEIVFIHAIFAADVDRGTELPVGDADAIADYLTIVAVSGKDR